MAFGIICEYNPFHNGHLHQINEIKKLSDEPIVCVMSGHLTQRGELAVTDKYSRAEMALRAGADLVLELPVPYCISSAEYFASAGVQVLASVGVDKLCFGSESADAKAIERVARVAASEEFRATCASLSAEEGSAAGYFRLLAEATGEGGICSNDILGIEYTKAIIGGGYNMEIYPIKRVGSAYRETLLVSGENPSASAIREKLGAGEPDDVAGFVPQSTLDMLKGGNLASISRIGSGILLALRLADPSKLEVAINDVGLVNRILALAHECSDYDEFFARLQTKKYTSSALRRAILFILLGITHSDISSKPRYTLLLGASGRGREHLSSIRKTECGIGVVTKPADAPICRQRALSERADALYTMCLDTCRTSGHYLKKSPVIVD